MTPVNPNLKEYLMKLPIACLTACSLLLIPITRASADVASSDKTFVTKASQGGMTEVEAGKLAQEKASSQDVKDFGAMMVKDHTQNDDDLMALAKTKGLTPSTDLDLMHKAMIDKLNMSSGADFDKAYIKNQVAGHKSMLKLMQKEESSTDPDLKAFATKTADTVQMHLSKAEDLGKGMMK
jgi:putative membrane protein